MTDTHNENGEAPASFWGWLGDETQGIVGPLGVVYGDIGTSPLYAMTEVFFGAHVLKHSLGGSLVLDGMPTLLANDVLGVTSLFFWALVVLTLKYIVLIMQADLKGEGGIFVLLSLLTGKDMPWWVAELRRLTRFGAALLVADGVITPAISVLSAEEGLAVMAPALEPWIVPIAAVTLLGLFSVQQFGTEAMGKFMGPVMLIWFVVIAALGIPFIWAHPQVLLAVNPLYGFDFLAREGWESLHVLGGVVLCITGGEALYADMGHFSRERVRKAWFVIVLPALMLNYFGQAGRVLEGGHIERDNIFYSLVPTWSLAPMILLATAATIIASQALISGSFSLFQQAMNLGVFPALPIRHTNWEHRGQIYIPAVNWGLCVGCVALVVFFQKSTALAAAYGIAVTGTMAISTLAFHAVATRVFRWNWMLMLPVTLGLVAFDLAFFGANLTKFFQGGYVPVVIALTLFLIMEDWIWGRAKERDAHKRFANKQVSWLLEEKAEARREGEIGPRVVETYRAVAYLCSRSIENRDDMVPPAALTHMRRNGILPRHIAFINFQHLEDEPYHDGPRFELIDFGLGVVSMVGKYGFMEDPSLDEAMQWLAEQIELSPDAWSLEAGEPEFFINEETPMLLQWAGQRYRTWYLLAVPAYARFAGSSRARSRISRTVVPVEIRYRPGAEDATFEVVMKEMLV